MFENKKRTMYSNDFANGKYANVKQERSSVQRGINTSVYKQQIQRRIGEEKKRKRKDYHGVRIHKTP